MALNRPIFPFDLPGFDQLPAPPDAAWVRRTRRKLDAEFEFQGSVTIELNGIEVDRSTALRALEELEDPEKAQFYFQYRGGSVQQLLSGDFSEMRESKLSYWQRIFEQSPKHARILAEALGALFVDRMKKGDPTGLEAFPLLLRQLSPNIVETVFFLPRRQLKKYMGTIRDLCDPENKFSQNLQAQQYLWDPGLLETLNHLGSKFESERNLYVQDLIKYLQRILYEAENITPGLHIVQNALLLRTHPKIHKDLEAIERQLKNRLKPFNRKQLKRLLKFVFFLLFMAVTTYHTVRSHTEEESPKSHLTVDDASSPELDSLWSRLQAFMDEKAPMPPNFRYSAYQPANGEQLYSSFLPPTDLPDTQQIPLIIDNTSGGDRIVFFCQKAKNPALILHAFIRSDSSLQTEIPPGHTYTLVLGGKKPFLAKQNPGEPLFFFSEDFRFYGLPVSETISELDKYNRVILTPQQEIIWQ